MALWQFTNLNKHGNKRSRIIHREGSTFSYTPSKFGDSVVIKRHMYQHTHPSIPPILMVDKEGNKRILPSWTKVHPKTTLEDIHWEKPKPKPKPKVWTFKSSSSDTIYYTKVTGNKIKCSCPGYFRSRGNCKHVKQVKSEFPID
jgi:hypothetical protein